MHLFDSLVAFVNKEETVFSVSDINKIEEELESFLEYYKVNKLWKIPVIKDGRSFHERVRTIRTATKTSTETPPTHKVDRIAIVHHTHVIMDEVRSDFARLITPYLLELIVEEEKKETKKKKKKAKKKSDPDDKKEK